MVDLDPNSSIFMRYREVLIESLIDELLSSVISIAYIHEDRLIPWESVARNVSLVGKKANRTPWYRSRWPRVS